LIGVCCALANRPTLLTGDNIPGADVIVRKVLRFIAHHKLGSASHLGNWARHEWLRLAHDDIGAWERVRFMLCGVSLVRNLDCSAKVDKEIPKQEF
jgi:hypothetical protein